MKWAFAVSDGAFNAQIWDVIIDPAFQVCFSCCIRYI